METRRKVAKAKEGARNPRWRGGISGGQVKVRETIDYQIWRTAVITRDSFTCQECGKRGGRLIAHHIKSFAEYPELRLAIDNGKTLCLKCHKLTDNYAGRKSRS